MEDTRRTIAKPTAATTGYITRQFNEKYIQIPVTAEMHGKHIPYKNDFNRNVLK